MNEPPQYSWTQPICDSCYKIVFFGRSSRWQAHPVPEICVYCGLPAVAGIYIRLDPAAAYHPSLQES